MKRIIVCTGGRTNWDSERHVERALGRIWPDLVIVGDAKGIDTVVRNWCEKNRVDHLTSYAWWDQLQGRAGPQRNGRMVGYVGDIHDGRELSGGDTVIGCLWFPGNNGTEDCKKQARKAGLEILSGAEVANPNTQLGWPWEGRLHTDLVRRNPAWLPQ